MGQLNTTLYDIYKDYLPTHCDYSDAEDLYFCDRDGKLSVVVATENYDVFVKNVGSTTAELAGATREANRTYLWDAESLLTDVKRVYYTGASFEGGGRLGLVGYYVTNSGVSLKKQYRNEDKNQTIECDYYEDGKLLVTHEEVNAPLSTWTGDETLIELAEANNLNCLVIIKPGKNATYLRVCLH